MNHFFIKTPDDARRERENFAMAPVIYKGWSEKSTCSGEGGPRAKADRHESAQLVQLAEELGISVSAAKVRLHRARAQLRADLSAPTGGEAREL